MPEDMIEFKIWHEVTLGFEGDRLKYEYKGSISMPRAQLCSEGTFQERIFEDLDRIWCIGNGEGIRYEDDGDRTASYRAFAGRSLMVGDLIGVDEAIWRIAHIGFTLAPDMVHLITRS